MLEVLAWRPELSIFSWINFQPNREAVSSGLIFVNIICTQPEPIVPILIEINKNHQITLTEGRIGFSSSDVADKEEPKYQIRNPYELTNAIITTATSTTTAFFYTPDDCLQLYRGTDDSILQQPHSIAHCISRDAKMSKGFADLLSQQHPGLRDACTRTKLLTGQSFPFLDQTGNWYIYNSVTRTNCFEKPNLPILSLTLEVMKSYAHCMESRPLQILKLDADWIGWTGRSL